jgi:hypothetical protein
MLYNGTARSKYLNIGLNTNIYSYLDISGGQSSNLYFNVIHFSTPVFIRHMWQLKTVVFLHWCLKHALLLIADYSEIGPHSLDGSACYQFKLLRLLKKLKERMKQILGFQTCKDTMSNDNKSVDTMSTV